MIKRKMILFKLILILKKMMTMMKKILKMKVQRKIHKDNKLYINLVHHKILIKNLLKVNIKLLKKKKEKETFFKHQRLNILSSIKYTKKKNNLNLNLKNG